MSRNLTVTFESMPACAYDAHQLPWDDMAREFRFETPNLCRIIINWRCAVFVIVIVDFVVARCCATPKMRHMSVMQDMSVT